MFETLIVVNLKNIGYEFPDIFYPVFMLITII